MRVCEPVLTPGPSLYPPSLAFALYPRFEYIVSVPSNPVRRRKIMTDEELKEKVKEVLSELGVWSGHREMTIDEIATIQPGLARIMPEVGQRTWKLYYAAKEEHWE